MQAMQILEAAQDDQLILRPGGCNVEQFLVVPKPLVGRLMGSARNGGGEQNHILLVALKRVDCPADGIINFCRFQTLLNHFLLIDKRRDDTDGFFRMRRCIADDFLCLTWRSVLTAGDLIRHINKYQRFLFFTL